MQNQIVNKGSKKVSLKTLKTSTANLAKRKSKNWRFIEGLLKRNKIVEVMIGRVPGKSPHWGGSTKKMERLEATMVFNQTKTMCMHLPYINKEDSMSKKRATKGGGSKKAAANVRINRQRKLRLRRKKLRKFCNNWIKRNGIVQVMILKADGKSSLWKGNMLGNVIGLFDDANKLYNVIKTLEKEKVKYQNVFINIHQPIAKSKPNVKLNKLHAVSVNVVFA